MISVWSSVINIFTYSGAVDDRPTFGGRPRASAAARAFVNAVSHGRRAALTCRRRIRVAADTCSTLSLRILDRRCRTLLDLDSLTLGDLGAARSRIIRFERRALVNPFHETLYPESYIPFFGVGSLRRGFAKVFRVFVAPSQSCVIIAAIVFRPIPAWALAARRLRRAECAAAVCRFYGYDSFRLRRERGRQTLIATQISFDAATTVFSFHK
ncbi:hypothetical protein EVAR_37319_1 [Eumeta japonica]|uniref:Uncharacterized protein n=1 Tax=Eumeta variegata TaxID=151549 RepID=A0A4C1X1L0_EUMVA|nr:hypothetical protein EVAR_37319_1 [Eumeta japonica]